MIKKQTRAKPKSDSKTSSRSKAKGDPKGQTQSGQSSNSTHGRAKDSKPKGEVNPKKNSKPKSDPKPNAPLREKYDVFIDGLMDDANKTHKDELHTELLNKIPLTDSYTNSLSIAVGKQRSGKTRKIIKEIIKISKMHKETHMLIYCNKTGGHTDKTFESFASLVKCPVVYVSQDDLEERLMDLIKYKNIYNAYKKQGVDELFKNQTDGYQGGEFSAGFFDPLQPQQPMLSPDQMEEIQDMFDVLGINNFNRDYLHTLILLDDIANSPLLTKPTTYLNSLMTQCAHINCSFFLAVQYWKGLPSAIKSQCAVIYMFGGFPKQQVRYMLSQICLEDPFDEIWKKYQPLKNKDFFVVDCIAGTYHLIPSNVPDHTRDGLKKEIIEKAHDQIEGNPSSDSDDDLTDIFSDDEPEKRTGGFTNPPVTGYIGNYSVTNQVRGIASPVTNPGPVRTPLINPTPITSGFNPTPIQPVQPIEMDWEAIWNRNKNGIRASGGGNGTGW